MSDPLPAAVVDPLLFLLQLSDSAFPIGSYSHSWGLETAVQTERITSEVDLQVYLAGLLHQAIAPQEGSACYLAHTYSRNGDGTAFAHLQDHLSAARWAQEPLRASLDLGQRLDRLSGKTWQLHCPGVAALHHSTAFGWLCGLAGVEAAATVRAYLLGAATNLVSAAVRLVPLGHTQGQQAIACLHAEIEAVLPRCLLATDLTAIASFALLQERDCQRHRHLYTRLFQS